MKINEITESTTAGGTSAGAVATVASSGKMKKQKKNKDGTVQNALNGDNLMSGQVAKR